MSKDFITTISGLLAAIGMAMGNYAQQNPDLSGVGFYIGMAGAVAMVVWGYFTNKAD